MDTSNKMFNRICNYSMVVVIESDAACVHNKVDIMESNNIWFTRISGRQVAPHSSCSLRSHFTPTNLVPAWRQIEVALTFFCNTYRHTYRTQLYNKIYQNTMKGGCQKYIFKRGTKHKIEKSTTTLLGLGEQAEKISANLDLFCSSWKLSRQLLLSVLCPTLSLWIPNLALQLSNLTLKIPNLVQVRILEISSWVNGEPSSVIGE